MSEDQQAFITKSYYDSEDADYFYFQIWGGEDIHIGIYESPSESIYEASRRSIQKMAGHLPRLDADIHVLDLGAGYGGSARYLAQNYGCRVSCLNISEKENERNLQKTKEAGLEHLVQVYAGNFEEVPFPDHTFEVVWSQEAILHSGQKDQVIREAARVLKPGGHLIFTDPMAAPNSPEEVLQPILERIHLSEMATVDTYRQLAVQYGLISVEIELMPAQLTMHYSRVKEELLYQMDELKAYSSEEYLQRMEAGLEHWIQGGKKGYLDWGILHFQKPDTRL